MNPDTDLESGLVYRTRDRSTGAALTEMIVLSFVMIPLMFAMPMIGKLADLRQTAVQAGRYATWEATVAASADTGPRQVDIRFFGKSEQAPRTEPPEFEGNGLWGGPSATGHDEPGDEFSDEFAEGGWPAYGAVRIDAATINAAPWGVDGGDLGIAGTVGDAILSAGKVLGGSRWDLAENALTRATVGVDVQMNGWFDEQGIRCGNGAAGCVSEGGVILVDGWEAGTDTQAKDRVKALVPASHLEPVGKLLSHLGAFPILEELRDVEHMFGHVDMTPLPAHADHGLDVYEER